jgi:hypothetical protein
MDDNFRDKIGKYFKKSKVFYLYGGMNKRYLPMITSK